MTATGIDRRCVLIQAPAKINLFLEIKAKRSDGYHELETVMVGVSLVDSLRFQSTADSRIEVRCTADRTLQSTSPAIPSGPGNIAWQALDRLRSALQSAYPSLGGTLEIFKRIPDQAGLGGGSSDAAAALRAACDAWQVNIAPDQLARIAAEVGSDVPFFLQAGAAVCRGRGELVEPVPSQPLWFVIAKPPLGLSTRTVYNRLTLPQISRSPQELIQLLKCGSPHEIGRSLFNRLQGSAEALAPEIRHAASEFDALCCCGHQLTGSGSAYFGLFANRPAAHRGAAVLRSRLPNWFVFVCHSLVSRPTISSALEFDQELHRDHN